MGLNLRVSWRAKGWASETISTLLMNYVAILLVSFFLSSAPGKTRKARIIPKAPRFLVPAHPAFFFRVTGAPWGPVLAIAGTSCSILVMSRTRWGLEMRAMGINQEAARRSGIPIGRYMVILMFIGGGLAGLAGMGEVSAIQGRLRPSLSPGFGYTGFLISWMAGGNPLGILAAAFLLSVVTAGGDILQMTQAIPGAVVNILMALILFVVLARRSGKGAAK